MDKLAAIDYLTNNNPVCDDCARGNLNQIRIAAGLYQLVKEIINDNKDIFVKEELDLRIREITSF